MAKYGKDKTLGSGNWAEAELNPRRIDLKPGRRSKARRKGKSRPLIGRRKTARTKVGRLVTRKTRRKLKSAMFRASVKKYPCPFCARADFLGEKGLKKHIAKFHEAGKRSIKGYRTARSADEFTVVLQRGGQGDKTWTHSSRSGAESRADSLSELHGGRVECPVRERGNTYIVDATKYYENSKPYVPGNRRRRS